MNRTKKLVLTAILAAAALCVYVLEAQIPAPIPVPGVKLGLANVITLTAMVLLDRKLAGGVLAAKQGMPVVLVKEPVPTGVKNYVTSADAPKFYIFGGTGAISEKTAKELIK